MSDLVLAVEKALADRWRGEQLRNDSDPEVDAYVALQAIHDAGWRIVRTHHDGDTDLDDDPDAPTYGEDVERAHITEEWTP